MNRCEVCNTNHKRNSRFCSITCKNKNAYKIRKERDSKFPYALYYLPVDNYCGVTGQDIRKRISSHKKKGKDITGWRVLYTSFNKEEAFYTEARFQSELGMFGLNFK